MKSSPPLVGRIIAFVLVMITLSWAAPARAQVVSKTAKFEISKQLLLLSVRYDEIIDAGVQKEMKTGFPTTIATRAYIFEKGGSSPIALVAKSCQVTYDVWEQQFLVQLSQPDRRQSEPVVNINGVFRLCGGLDKIPLIDYAKLATGKTYFIQAIVEVNPVSPQMLARISKWISRPAGSTSIGPSDALFGSFVGLFANQIGQADRILTFRTQDFVLTSTP
ncbi:MAG: hypothetical protein U0165_15835 [Polyangiaceae bacterium]